MTTFTTAPSSKTFRVLAAAKDVTVYVRAADVGAGDVRPKIIEQSAKDPNQLLLQLRTVIPTIVEAVKDSQKTIAAKVADAKLKEISLEFGLTASAEVDAWIVDFSGEAALSVKVVWEPA